MVRAAAVLLSLAVPACWAQAVISARSGMVNFIQGEVQIEGQPVKLDGAIFPDVKPGEVLSTRGGFAEILLTPGVFLRLDRNSSFRMVSNKLTDTQVEMLTGSALVEVDEILKYNRVAMKMGDAETVLLKAGLYHFNAATGQLRAFSGRAQVSDGSASTEIRGGRTLLVGSLLTPDKFDKDKSKDELYAWSEQRDYRLELSNILTARGTNTNGLSSSLWVWDPWFSMYTFLPRSGYMDNPFGIYWYSPGTVWFAPPVYITGSGGTRGITSAGNSSSQHPGSLSPSSGSGFRASSMPVASSGGASAGFPSSGMGARAGPSSRGR